MATLLLSLAFAGMPLTAPLYGDAVPREIKASNPKVLPEGEYPYWPEYDFALEAGQDNQEITIAMVRVVSIGEE